MSNIPSTRTINKLKAIEILGGACKICGEKHPAKLVFHHINQDDKEEIINNLLQGSFYNIYPELKKCLLLCANCHRELHWTEVPEEKKTMKKEEFLKFKNIFACEQCGYSQCIAALDFHHLHNKVKRLALYMIECKGKTAVELTQSIKDELNKCNVLCASCHQCTHSQLKDINTYDCDYIKEKLSEIKYDEKFSPDLVIRDYKNGETNYRKIGQKYGIYSLTVKKILLRNGLIEKEVLDREKIFKLYETGLHNDEIAKLMNCNPKTVERVLKEKDIRSNRYTIGKDAIIDYCMKHKEKTYEEIANDLDCSACYIGEIMGPIWKKMNIKINEHRHKTNMGDVIRFYKNGMSIDELSKKSGYGAAYIRKKVKNI